MKTGKNIVCYGVIAATSGVFIVDLFLPLGYAVGAGYILPLLLASGLQKKKDIFVFTAFCSVLIVAGFFLKPAGVKPSIALFNRCLDITMLWTTSVLLFYRRRALMKLQESREALKDSEAKFRSLSEEALVGIYLVQDMRFLYVNPRFADMLGYSAAEILSIEDLSALMASEDAGSGKIIDDIFSGRARNVGYQLSFLRKDGASVEVEGICANTDYGGRPAVIGTALDVTRKKMLERQKADFYAMVTHDLKSPITSIMGYAELIAMDKETDANVRDMASGILHGSEKLNALVEDFLMHSKLESGIAALNADKVDAAALLMEIRDAFQNQAVKCGQTLTVIAGDGLPPLVADKAQITRALSNLVQNAINYTPEGGNITIKAELRAEAAGSSFVLSVADTGPGIPADEQTKVFKKYYRSHRTAGIKGTGLGLAIVKAVAEAHGGRVELQSEPGRGSTFSLVIPNPSETKAAA